jgi:hypothetical protein
VKKYLLADFPVRIEAPPGVSLFTYDNGAYVIESFNDVPVKVRVVKSKTSSSASANAAPGASARETASEVTIPPHSFRLFRNE